MDWFSIIKSSYQKGLYNNEQIDIFAEKGKITHEQAETIKSA